MATKEQFGESPTLGDEYMIVNGEPHVLNYETDILNLDENRDVSPGVDIEADNEVPTTTGTDSDEEGDVEVTYCTKFCYLHN